MFMRKNRKNISSTNPYEKLWHDQKQISGYLPYISVLRKLDELTTNGYTCLQIEEMLNLGEEQLKKNR